MSQTAGIPFVFHCPRCGQRISADADREGETTDCPKCGSCVLIEKDTQPAVPRTRKCPFCAEDIQVAAVKCKHCGSDLTRSSGAPSYGKSLALSIAVLALYIFVCWLTFHFEEDSDYGFLVCWGLSFWMCLGIGAAKRRALFGILLGLFTGPVGLIAMVFAPPAKPKR